MTAQRDGEEPVEIAAKGRLRKVYVAHKS